MALLTVGNKITLNVPLLDGWQGTGIVTHTQAAAGDPVWFAKLKPAAPVSAWGRLCVAMPTELTQHLAPALEDQGG